MDPHNDVPSTPTTERSLGRRAFLTAGVAGAATALAGCTAVLDYFAGMILKDVNVFNGTSRQLRGDILLADPQDERVLDSEFAIAPDTEGETDDESTALYADVFTGSGEYTVEIKLDENSAIEGQQTTSQSVTVEDPANQHVIVGLGVEDRTAPISIEVIREFSDLKDTPSA